MSKETDAVIEYLRQYTSTAFVGAGLRVAAVRIGNLLSNNITLENRKKLRVRTGRLINSLQHRIRDNGASGVEIEAGSYSVPYASIHEFGYSGIVNIRSHNRQGRKGKSHNVRAHTARRNIPARPYVQPGFDKSKPRIIEILRGLIK